MCIRDSHYPTKTGTDDPELRQYKIDNKQKCLQEINGWDDVDQMCIRDSLCRNRTIAKYGESESMPTVRLLHGGAGAEGD